MLMMVYESYSPKNSRRGGANSGVAQLAEQAAADRWIVGSSPTAEASNQYAAPPEVVLERLAGIGQRRFLNPEQER